MLSYCELEVWKESDKLCEGVLRIFSKVVWTAGSQIRRAAISVPTNIAEGAGRHTDIDFARFVSYARGSCYEVDYLSNLASRFGLISDDHAERVSVQCEKVGKMLDAKYDELVGVSDLPI